MCVREREKDRELTGVVVPCVSVNAMFLQVPSSLMVYSVLYFTYFYMK